MIIREANTNDINFITSSWSQSYYPKSNLSFDDYKHFQNKLMKTILHNSYNTVAVDDTDQSLIFGWICHYLYNNEPVVHYLYVKAIYRRLGVAKALMNEVMGNDKEYYYYTHKPENNKILDALTFVGGDYCEHLRYREFYEEA